MSWRDELDAVIYPLSLDELIEELRKPEPKKEVIERGARALEALKELLEG
jgi:hypothetical protein